MSKLMTIEEYLKKEGLSANSLAKRLNMHIATILKVKKGNAVRPATARRFNKVGIDVEVIGGVIEPDKICELKEFQLKAIAKYGNTIVSKEFTPKSIIKAFRTKGFKVKVEEFQCEDGWYEDTHYVVRLVR